VALISVREYEMLPIEESQPGRPSVTSKQAEILTNLKPVYGFELFKYVNKNVLIAQQYVGAIQLGLQTVEILPKIEGTEKEVRRNLVAMLALAHDLDISEGEAARVGAQNHGILEIMIQLFCDKLRTQLHKGLVRRYESEEENLTVLKGRLGIAEQVRLNAGNPERLYCRFDDFQEDIPLNQILKAGVRFLLNISREVSNQRQLAELMLIFQGVSDIPRQSLPWVRVAFDRLTEHYQPCFNLVELFLKGNPPDVTGGDSQAFSLFFDMNILFEEYIGRMVRRVFKPMGWNVILQGPQRYLAVDLNNQHPVFAMKPDITGMIGEQVAWIIDTKWKSLALQKTREGVLQDDLYQMYAYANCYDCSDVVLLYPHHRELGGEAGVRGNYTLNLLSSASEQPFRQMRVATVELSNLSTVAEQLKQILQFTAMYSPKDSVSNQSP
jgi:5-methylcytosine-specific restriction enzyme subunit McrC